MKKFYALSLIVFLTGCYMSKSLEKAVHVSIDPTVIITRSNTGNSTFTDVHSDDEFSSAFLSNLKAELVRSEVIIDDISPSYVIEDIQLSITESVKTETVNDTTSEENGMVFELTTLNFSATGKLRKTDNGSSNNWSASKSKSEKVKSSRNIVQLATGQNKERNEYREKDFDSGDAIRLTGVCGDNSGTVVVKAIIKDQK